MVNPSDQQAIAPSDSAYRPIDVLPPTVSTTGQPIERHPYLRLENIHKQFGAYTALRQIYLDVYPGEFVCLLGPSGCGKTTLLRIVAGLEMQTSGRVIQAGMDISRLPPTNRDFGIVFQSYALFPNLTAAKNIAYGLENARLPKAKIDERVNELLDLVGLDGLEHQYPAQMSGGQQQRVALARALALSPGLLLLDEPLSALDAKVRVRLRTEIAQLQKRLGITTVMVTHDQAEALAMGDRIVVMDRGYIAQVGTAQAIYQRPQTPFVANFIGVMNFLQGTVVAPNQVRCGNLLLEVAATDSDPGTFVAIAIRPEDIRVVPPDSSDRSQPNVLTAVVESLEFLGACYLVTLRPDGNAKTPMLVEISIYVAQTLDLSMDATLTLHLPPQHIRTFPAERHDIA